MRNLVSFYRTINILSIDVALGAVCSALFFASILQVTITPYGLIALALTVWIIYTADHLRDAKTIGHSASSNRHLFHQRNFKNLFIFISVGIIVDITLLFFIRHQVFLQGLVLAGVVLLYLMVHTRLHFMKEIFVAVLYTAGVLLPSYAVTNVNLSFVHYLLFFQFFLVALLNLLIFSFYDSDSDARDNLKSFVVHFGKTSSAFFICVLFAILFCLNVIQLALGNYTSHFTVIMAMTVILVCIFFLSDIFSVNDHYRLLGDAIFFLPILALL